MCYAFTPVFNPTGSLVWLPKKVLEKFQQEGKIRTSPDGFYYARDDVDVFYWINGGAETGIMHWDFIPGHFLQDRDLPLDAMLREKNSRAKNSKGFSSYNARIETIDSLSSFRKSWKDGRRCVVPAESFLERPNMEEAPKEFRGREYRVRLSHTGYLGGIWDTWRNRVGEKLDSFSIITVDSRGNEKLQGIWHERCPVVLQENQVAEWLDPKTGPDRARELCRLIPAENIDVEEILKKRQPAGEPNLFDAP